MKAEQKTTTASRRKTKPNKISFNKQEHDRIAHLASLMNNISYALISTELKFKVREWNQAAETIYGWRAVEVISHHVQEFIQSEYLSYDYLKSPSKFWDGTQEPHLRPLIFFKLSYIVQNKEAMKDRRCNDR